MSEYYEEYRDEPSGEQYRLSVIDSVKLADARCKRTEFLVSNFLKPGLAVIAGAPKIGKSWLVLQLCFAVAKGEPFWGMDTRQGTVLYIDLEDSEGRLQDRILRCTEEPSEHFKISFECNQLGGGIAEEISSFAEDYPDTRLVVIDTFQKIRMPVAQASYAVDYTEISHLKRVADELNICILLVHHTRKMGDSDAVNEISGTNGIAGSADTLMVMKKEKRTDHKAKLYCTGRDIEDRELELLFDREEFRWKKISDTLEETEEEQMPEMLFQLVDFMKQIKKFDRSYAEFCCRFASYLGKPIHSVWLKRHMNRFRYQLEDRGISFMSYRTKSERLMMIVYSTKHDLYANQSPADDSMTVDDSMMTV